MDFNIFYISENRNEYLLQISCLLIYFICDVKMKFLCQPVYGVQILQFLKSLSHKIK